jgi:hypothetical protein
MSTDETLTLLAEVEAASDALYAKAPLPHPNRRLAEWYLLTVCEDWQRSMLCTVSDQQAANAAVLAIDRAKYSLRHGLERIRKESSDRSWEKVPRRIIPLLYEKTARLLMAGMDFIDAIKLCTGAYEQTVRLTKRAAAIEVVLDPLDNDMGYSALELIGSEQHDVPDFVTLLFVWMHIPEVRIPAIVWQIADSVRLKKGLLIYDYEQGLAIELAGQVPQQRLLVPEAWRFVWGGRAETTLLLNALSIRCIYHFIAVHFSSVRRRLRGGGVANICLVATVEALTEDLCLMCSLPNHTITEFLQFLTYGHGTNTPDPALQPLILLDADEFAVPCIHYLSSNQERNLLSLQARVEPGRFDSQSGQFEKAMVAKLKAALGERWPLLRCNVSLTIAGVTEEIDLLVADTDCRTLLVAELRWMLGPGDAREVQNRKRVCREKVTQLERKVQWVQLHAIEALRGVIPLAIDSSYEQPWNVVGVVIIENFGGARSANHEIPIMPFGVFEIGMLCVPSLLHFATWSRSLAWLPQQGVHFEIHTEEVALAGTMLRYPGGSQLVSRSQYLEYVSGTLLDRVARRDQHLSAGTSYS